MTKWDSVVTRIWVQLGLMTTFGPILPPPLLILFAAPGADRLAYFKRRYGCHSRELGADISAPSARRKPDAFAITGGDILA